MECLARPAKEPDAPARLPRWRVRFQRFRSGSLWGGPELPAAVPRQSKRLEERAALQPQAPLERRTCRSTGPGQHPDHLPRVYAYVPSPLRKVLKPMQPRDLRLGAVHRLVSARSRGKEQGFAPRRPAYPSSPRRTIRVNGRILFAPEKQPSRWGPDLEAVVPLTAGTTTAVPA
jgi:hypothetical protein